MSVEYFQIGGLMDFRATDYSRVAPFFVMTLGATRFAPDDESGLGDEFRFSVVLGAGVKVMLLTDRFGIRVQGRMLTTFLSSESTIFCPGAMRQRIESETRGQIELNDFGADSEGGFHDDLVNWYEGLPPSRFTGAL